MILTLFAEEMGVLVRIQKGTVIVLHRMQPDTYRIETTYGEVLIEESQNYTIYLTDAKLYRNGSIRGVYLGQGGKELIRGSSRTLFYDPVYGYTLRNRTVVHKGRLLTVENKQLAVMILQDPPTNNFAYVLPYDLPTITRFRVGDQVTVRSNLVVGCDYYNEDSNTYDTFTSHMEPFKGQPGNVTEVDRNGKYRLTLSSMYQFTDEMLVDALATKTYTQNVEVEETIHTVQSDMINAKIDQALDERLYLTDPSAFQKLVDEKKGLT